MKDRTMGAIMGVAGVCLAVLAAVPNASSSETQSGGSPVAPADKADGEAAAAPPPGFLAGPTVSDEKVEKPADVSAMRRDSRRSITVPARRWMRMVSDLDLRNEQRIAIEEQVTHWRQETGRFQREHGEELQSLREQVRAAREGTIDRVADAQAQRKRLQAIQSKWPKVEDYQHRIWEMLDEVQQEHLRLQLEEVRREMMERRRGERDAMADDQQMDDRPDAADSDRRGRRRPADARGGVRGRGPGLDDGPRWRSLRSRQRDQPPPPAERDRRIKPEKGKRAPEKVDG